MTEADWPTSKTNINDPETRHLGEERVIPPVSGSVDYVTDDAHAEVAELQSAGVDVEIVDYGLSGHYELDQAKQQLVTHAIETYSQVPGFADQLKQANPAVAGWLAMAKAKSPLALNFFYNMADMERPSDGLSEAAILNTPLHLVGEESGKTALELVRELNKPARADIILGRIDSFFNAGSLKEGTDGFGLSAYEIMAGSLDRIGDVTRAKALIDIVTDHIHASPDEYEGRGLVSASLASGAAEPVFWLMEALEAEGRDIDTLHLVDIDPIALAASSYRSDKHGFKDKIAMHRQNLLGAPIDSYIKPHSVDVVDLIGLFEYIRRQFGDTPMASELLKNAGSIVRPGGIIVFGNMLESRPQQKWFEGLWPSLQQRSINEVIEIVEEAGYSRDQLKIRIPKDGVYGVYGIEIPKNSTDVSRGLGRVASPQLV